MTEIQTEPEHIAISKSKGIQIDWKDGHHSQYALGYLRDECPCATCTGAHGTAPQKSDNTAAGYTSVDSGTLTISGQTITVSALTLATNGTLTVTYGDTTGNVPNAVTFRGTYADTGSLGTSLSDNSIATLVMNAINHGYTNGPTAPGTPDPNATNNNLTTCVSKK